MRILLSALCALTVMGMPINSVAEEAAAAPKDQVVEEILVVARFEEESLQDTTVAVTALDQETLDNFRIDEAADLISRIPALNVSTGGSGAGAQITLRGIGSSFISNAFDSAIALNYDGVSVSTQRLLQAAFFDVEQVAVLKGPQSLYFGKAASAGVMTLRSANPTDEWESSAKFSYETEEVGVTLGGHVSGPISETLGFRLAAEHQDIDEYVKIAEGNPTTRRDRGLDNLIARATLQWEPDDRLSATLKVDYNKQRSDTLNGRLDIFCGRNGPDPSVLLGGALTGGGIPGIDLFLPTHDCDIKDGKFTGPDANALLDQLPAGSPGEGRNFLLAYNDTETWFTRLAMDYALTDSLDVSLLVGYVDLENEYNDTFNSTGRNPNGSAAGLPAPFENTLKQLSIETRLASNFEGPFNFYIGAFWEDRDIGHRTSQNAFNPSLLGVFGPPFGRDVVTGATFDWLADRPIDAEALSFFTSADLELGEKWLLTGGVRWTDEKKSTSTAFPFVHSGVVAIFGTVTTGFQSPDVKFKDDNVSPELTLRYFINDDMSVYAAYKTGFKSGGVDNNTLPTGSVVGLISPNPAVREAAEALLRFESEESEGFEVGLRSQWLDRALTINATAFRYVYENQQVQQFDPAVFAFRTFNAGEVTTAGLEVDFFWATQVQGLSFSGSWAYLDSEITGALASPGGSLKGRDAGFSPEFSGNLAINWDFNLGDSLMLRISPNFAYKGEYFVGGASPREFDPVTNPLGDLVQDAYTTIDLNVSLFAPDEAWRISLIARNLTDEQYFTFAGPAPFRPATGDDQLVGFGRGQQIFLEAALRF